MPLAAGTENPKLHHSPEHTGVAFFKYDSNDFKQSPLTPYVSNLANKIPSSLESNALRKLLKMSPQRLLELEHALHRNILECVKEAHYYFL